MSQRSIAGLYGTLYLHRCAISSAWLACQKVGVRLSQVCTLPCYLGGQLDARGASSLPCGGRRLLAQLLHAAVVG